MKTIASSVLTAIVLLLSGTAAFAQNPPADNTVTTTTETTETWHVEPWMYAVGAAIFVLIVIALLRNNRRA